MNATGGAGRDGTGPDGSGPDGPDGRETQSLAPAGAARFAPGERVRVRRMRPAGHTRCPRYVRGATGVVQVLRGSDAFPDIGPYRGPSDPVYSVELASEDLFGPSDEERWTVSLDLFESETRR